MKTIFKTLTLSVAALSCGVWAAPQVGDYAVLAGKISSGGQSFGIETHITNMQINSGTGEVLVRTTHLIEGQDPQIENEWKAGDQIIDQEMAPAIASAVCEQSDGQGVMENVTTPAGTFSTCKMPVDGGFMWIGGVPSGIVKADFTNDDGTSYSGQLKEYAWR